MKRNDWNDEAVAAALVMTALMGVAEFDARSCNPLDQLLLQLQPATMMGRAALIVAGLAAALRERPWLATFSIITLVPLVPDAPSLTPAVVSRRLNQLAARMVLRDLRQRS